MTGTTTTIAGGNGCTDILPPEVTASGCPTVRTECPSILLKSFLKRRKMVSHLPVSKISSCDLSELHLASARSLLSTDTGIRQMILRFVFHRLSFLLITHNAWP